jgi:D-serine dehydratase
MAFRQRGDDRLMHDDDTPRPGWLGPWLKGFPSAQPPLPLADVAARGWTLAALPTPLAVVRRQALAHNIAWMQRFAAERGVQLAPHGKTTMSPQLFRRQLDAGAWGLTFANVHQLRLGLAAGARRALIANQLVGRADLAELLALRRQHAGVELAFFVDSQAQLDLLAAHWAALGVADARLDVLIELGSTRCGLRTHDPALALARALQHHPALRLRGIGFYEGLQVRGETEPDRALMQQWQARVEALLADIEAEGLLDDDARPLWLSGGGSALFDLVAPVLAARPGQSPRLGLLRSGCYVCHDHAHYGRLMGAINARLGSPLGTDGLRPALEVWTEVLSVPEPGLALLNAGRRDLSFDQGWPLPVWHVHHGERHAAPAGWRIDGLNDQHAYLRWDPATGAGPAVGERVALGPSHPCTTFDKWAWLAVADEDDRVVDAITTHFG